MGSGHAQLHWKKQQRQILLSVARIIGFVIYKSEVRSSEPVFESVSVVNSLAVNIKTNNSAIL